MLGPGLKYDATVAQLGGAAVLAQVYRLCVNSVEIGSHGDAAKDARSHPHRKESPMRLSKMAATLVAAALAVGAAGAQVFFDILASVTAPKPTVTRPQIRAEFLMWHASGLYDLTHQGDSDVNTNRPDDMNAQARHAR